MILDADFPENLFESVLTTLTISPSPSSASHAAEVQRISQDVVPGLPELYEKLNAQPDLPYQFRVKLKQIQDTEKRVGELKRIQMANRNTLSALGDPAKTYGELRARWNDAYKKKIKLLEKQCRDFSSLSNGLIKAEIKSSLDVESLRNIASSLSQVRISKSKRSRIYVNAFSLPRTLS